MQALAKCIASLMAMYGYAMSDYFWIFIGIVLWEISGGFVATISFIISGFGR